MNLTFLKYDNGVRLGDDCPGGEKTSSGMISDSGLVGKLVLRCPKLHSMRNINFLDEHSEKSKSILTKLLVNEKTIHQEKVKISKIRIKKTEKSGNMWKKWKVEIS